jgi:hypothetical protein
MCSLFKGMGYSRKYSIIYVAFNGFQIKHKVLKTFPHEAIKCYMGGGGGVP